MALFRSVGGSGTIQTGGTSQALFGGIMPTSGYRVVNPDATNDLWVCEEGAAAANGQGSMRIQANGGWYETAPDTIPVGSPQIVGGVTGQKFTAMRW